MARLWQCGFELNTLTTAVEVTTTSGTVSVQTGTVRTGTYALRSNPTAGVGFARQHVFASDQAIVGYQRFYLNIATLPNVTGSVCRFLDASNNSTGAIRISTGGALQLLKADGTQIGSSSATLSTGTWYMVELKTDATGSGALDARLDGSSFASGANSAQGNWSRCLIGIVGSNTTCDLYIDDWAINDASGSAQTSWPGAGKILHLLPNGDGDAHGWNNTANTAGSSSNYTLVNEVSPNDSTSLVQTGTLNAEDMYALADSGIGSGDVVNVVMVGMRGRNNVVDASAAAKLQIKKTSGGTITQGSAIVPNTAGYFTNAPAEPRNYSLVTYLDPDGVAWTQATLDTAQAGVKLTTANTNRVQVTTLWLSVDYTPSTTTPVSDADTGSGAEASTLAAGITTAETSSGAEASSLTATAASTETGAATESATLTVQVSDADTGSGAETASVTAALLATETGSGLDGATNRTLTAADTGSGADAGSQAAMLTASDTAAGVEASTLAATLTSGETGTGADAGTADDGSSSNQNVSSADTGSATETATLAAAITSADTATAIEAATISAQLATVDVAFAVDASSLTAVLLAADTGHAAEVAAADDGTDDDRGIATIGTAARALVSMTTASRPVATITT